MSQIRQAERKQKNKAFWPLIGFVLAVAIGVFAWFIAPDVARFALARLPQLGNAGTVASLRPIFAGLVFIVVGGIAALIVALMVSTGTPKDPTQVREKDMVKQRTRLVREKEARKRRQRDINRQMKSGK